VRARSHGSSGNGRDLDSPFLDAELSVAGRAPEYETTAPRTGLQSPFLDAFSPVAEEDAAVDEESDSTLRYEDHSEEGEEPAALETDFETAADDEGGAAELDEERASGDYEGEGWSDDYEAAEAPSPKTLRMRSGSDFIAARILWPALGFPAVIAPRPNGSTKADTADPRRSICVLLLSEKARLTEEDVARHLRIVPWSDRTRRHLRNDEPGSFTSSELKVRNDDGGRTLSFPRKDRLAQAVVFGGDKDGNNSIVVSLATSVREFYRKQGLPHLHEVRVSESAAARLTGGQYHLFWNNHSSNPNAPSDEMALLLDRFAKPRRATLGAKWKNDLPFFLEEYKYDYGALHPPYHKAGQAKPFTEVLHPVFVQRIKGPLRIGHLTDTHVDVRADVYEENLKLDRKEMSWDGKTLRHKNAAVSFNNWNRDFIDAYRDLRENSDVVLLTGDLIDYGRGHVGLVSGGRHRHRLGEDDAYHADRNWFLFYHLLASGASYTRPAYTILGNHDWRFSPYPPFAPGAPSPSSLIHNYRDFPGDAGKKQMRRIIEIAHGPGHGIDYAYALIANNKLATAWRHLKALPRGISRELDIPGSPVQTTIDSVIWYLLLINPFLDYAFAHPNGQRFLMLDWAEDEEVSNFDEPRSFENFGQRAAKSLTPLQKWQVEEFVSAPGKAKVIGIHAPPLGPYPEWSEEALANAKQTYSSKQDSRVRKPDGTILELTEHTTFAIRPKDAPYGVAADHGSFLESRDWFITTIGKAGAGVRLVVSGHIHRNGLLVAYVPTGDQKKRWIVRSVTHQEVRSAPPPKVASRRSTSGQVQFPAPLYANTTSGGPRGNHYGASHTAVPPGYAIFSLESDGTITNVSTRQLVIPAPAAPLKTREAAYEVA
jgi:hypothetical protein